MTNLEKMKEGVVLSVNELIGMYVQEGRNGDARYHAYVSCPNEKNNVIFIQLRTSNGRLVAYDGKQITNIKIPLELDDWDDCYYGDRNGDIVVYYLNEYGEDFSLNAHQYDKMDILFATKQILVDMLLLIENENQNNQ